LKISTLGLHPTVQDQPAVHLSEGATGIRFRSVVVAS
jgi:hypothetical protein